MFVFTCLYPRILTSSYLQAHIPLLIFLHPHIFKFACACLYPCILISSGSCVLSCILGFSYPQVHVCLLVSSHPYVLISSAWYTLSYIPAFWQLVLIYFHLRTWLLCVQNLSLTCVQLCCSFFLLILSKALKKSINTNIAFLDEVKISSIILPSARICGKVDIPFLKPFWFHCRIGSMCSDIRLRSREL